MDAAATPAIPLVAVSLAARHPQTGDFLLVRRARPPAEGLWAFPGGRVEFGERLAEAALREFFEETGLEAANVRFFRLLELIGDPDHHFLLAVHAAVAEGVPVAGDDAAEARWVSLADMQHMNLTGSVLDYAREIAAGA